MWYCRVQKEFAFQIASRVVSTKRVMQWSNNCTVSNILKISAVNQNGGSTYSWQHINESKVLHTYVMSLF